MGFVCLHLTQHIVGVVDVLDVGGGTDEVFKEGTR